MTSKEAAIQEYQALRDEIISNWTRRSSRMGIAWAAVSALLVGGAIAQVPELGCLALILICSGWRDDLRWFDNMTRIGAYIKVVLESQIPGLQWETALSIIGEQQKKVNIIARVISTMFTTYGIFVLVCLSGSIIFYLQYPITSQIRLIMFWGLFGGGVLYTFSVLREAVSFGEKGEFGKKVFS